MADPAQDMLATMAATHRALLAGDFAALAQLAPLLDACRAALPPHLPAPALQALQRKAHENAALLRAAQRGLRSAARRIAEIRGVATGLSTYTAGGARQHTGPRGGSDHRA